MVQKTHYKTKDYCKVKFSLQPEKAKKVEVRGLNNNWQKGVTLTKKKDGTFSADIQLPKASRHEFRYLVDGARWINDNGADGEVANGLGETNSLLEL